MSTYIMRWNPSISSSKIEDLRQAIAKWPYGFRGDWSIYEWEKAKEDDQYVMVRVGAGANGIVFQGHFLSDPYEGKDWAGSNRKRYYVDISIEPPFDPDKPSISVEQLETLLPEIDWRKGHSGQLMTKEQEKKFWDFAKQILG